MTPAGVGNLLPGDSKTTHIIHFPAKDFRELLANIGQGAEGKTPQNPSRPNFFGLIFQLAPFRKSTICERQKANPTALAARLCEIDFLDNEPLLKTNKCPPFRNSSALQTLGLSQPM
jgi:hypothetical protein